MDPRTTEIARLLGLEAHPEGGAFRETHRSALTVSGPGGTERPALTHIYYLLAAGEFSRWHRIPQDEVWHVYQGDGLELRWIAPDWSRLECRVLTAVGAGSEPVAVVPGGCWQSARSSGAWSLAGCTVAPGFEFADFHLMSGDLAAAAELRRRFPDVERFLGASGP